MIIYRLTLNTRHEYADSLAELLNLCALEGPFARTVRLRIIHTRDGRLTT